MKWCQRPLLTFTIYQTYLFSLFDVKEVISLYWLLGASLGLLEDANECSGREKVDQRREKDWDAVISREYAKRPHRDGDIVSIPSGEGRQDSCWDFFFFYSLLIFSPHCVFRPHSMHDQLSSLIGPTLLSQTLLKHLSQRALWDQSYLWPPGTSLPFSTDPQSFHASSNLTVTRWSKYVQAAQMTIMLHFLSLRQRPLIAECRDRSRSHRPSTMGCVVLLFDFDKRRRGSSHFLQPDQAYCWRRGD